MNELELSLVPNNLTMDGVNNRDRITQHADTANHGAVLENVAVYLISSDEESSGELKPKPKVSLAKTGTPKTCNFSASLLLRESI